MSTQSKPHENKTAESKKQEEGAMKPESNLQEGKSPDKSMKEVGAETQRLQEKIPPKLVEGLAKAGRKPEDILSTASYESQKMWRVVVKQGPRYEIGFDGEWLNKPKPKVKKEVKDL